jgi:ComF family protein
MRPMSGPSCAVCGERVFREAFSGEDAAGELLCGACQQSRPGYERALAYAAYDGGLRDLIHLLKYQRVHPAANVLGRMLADTIAGLAIEAERVVVVPIPLHHGKQRQRGFNQALEITRAAMKLLPEKFQLTPERLLRIRDTQSQTGLTRYQRRENVRGAFVAVDPEKLQGATVLLVDDVFTTGTTVSECAKVMKRAGAEKVYVATVARVLKSDAAFAEPDVEEVEPTTKTMAAYA